MTLIDSLIKEGWLKTPRIIEAFRKIRRIDFLPENMKDLAELNEALPIGFGQTISQPLVVAFMMELLEPNVGDKILDIGSGSGWTSALLAHIVSGGDYNPPTTLPPSAGPSLKSKISPSQVLLPQNLGGQENQKSKIDGRVISIEIIPELKKFGEENIAKYNFIKSGVVEFICADGSKGYEKEAPFNKILASASIQETIPEAWKEQLKIGGRIVTPIRDSIWLLIKKSPSFAKATEGKEEEFEEKEYPGFVFVPLIERNRS